MIYERSYNLNIVIAVLGGLAIYNLPLHSFGLSHVKLWCSLSVLTYYFGLVLVYRSTNFLIALITTFIFLSCYLVLSYYLTEGDINVTSIFSKYKTPIFLYFNVLIPGLFFNSTANFFAMVKEISSYLNTKVSYYLISIITKRELILNRYNQIMEELYGRGINTKNFFGRYKYINLWVIPLLITTIFEGVESYEYNQMLLVEIKIYKPAELFLITKTQKTTLLGLSLTLIFEFVS